MDEPGDRGPAQGLHRLQAAADGRLDAGKRMRWRERRQLPRIDALAGRVNPLVGFDEVMRDLRYLHGEYSRGERPIGKRTPTHAVPTLDAWRATRPQPDLLRPPSSTAGDLRCG